MKANLRKLIGMAVLGLALFSHSIPAGAGQQIPPEEVTVGTDFARGSMVGARYSKDSTQYIACDFANGLGPSVSCAARDKTGKRFYCNSFDPRWATVVKAITDSSVISFGGSIGGACTSLVIENHSSHLK
jgi:hypothetical protein